LTVFAKVDPGPRRRITEDVFPSGRCDVALNYHDLLGVGGWRFEGGKDS